MERLIIDSHVFRSMKTFYTENFLNKYSNLTIREKVLGIYSDKALQDEGSTFNGNKSAFGVTAFDSFDANESAIAPATTSSLMTEENSLNNSEIDELKDEIDRLRNT